MVLAKVFPTAAVLLELSWSYAVLSLREPKAKQSSFGLIEILVIRMTTNEVIIMPDKGRISNKSFKTWINIRLPIVSY